MKYFTYLFILFVFFGCNATIENEKIKLEDKYNNKYMIDLNLLNKKLKENKE
jgi:hypothetical protein